MLTVNTMEALLHTAYYINFDLSSGEWRNRTPHLSGAHGFQDRLPTVQRHSPMVLHGCSTRRKVTTRVQDARHCDSPYLALKTYHSKQQTKRKRRDLNPWDDFGSPFRFRDGRLKPDSATFPKVPSTGFEPVPTLS